MPCFLLLLLRPRRLRRYNINVLSLLLLVVFAITHSFSLLSSSLLIIGSPIRRTWQPTTAVCHVSEREEVVSQPKQIPQRTSQYSNETILEFGDDDDDDEDDEDTLFDQEKIEYWEEVEDDDDDPNEEIQDDEIDMDKNTLSDSALQDLTNHILVNRTRFTINDFKSLEKIMRIWSRRRYTPKMTVHPAVQQERLLRRVVEEKMANNQLAWNVNMKRLYDLLIRTWSKSWAYEARERAEEILDAMQEAYNSGQEDLKPTIRTWNYVLQAYSKSKTINAADEVFRLLFKLHQLFTEGKTDVQPNRKSFALLLKTHVFGGSDAPEKILALLNKMKRLSSEGLTRVYPNSKCHNMYLRALLHSMKSGKVPGPEIARKAEAHFLHTMRKDHNPMSRPDPHSYVIVLTIWSKSGDEHLAERAEALVNLMTEDGHVPTAYVYNCLMNCYAQFPRKDSVEMATAVLEKMKQGGRQNPLLLPDNVSYNVVAHCLVKSRDPLAAEKVESLFEELSNLYRETRHWRYKLSIHSYNICFEAWAKSNDERAPKKIMQWIERMRDDFESGRTDAAPNKYAYNAYLEALSKRREPSNADEAERILEYLEDRNEQYGGSSNLKPDVLTYTNALHCIALSDADDSVQRAYAIFAKMEDGNVRPNEYTYNVLINSVAKSKLSGIKKATIAASLVKRMKDVSLRPTTITYNNALNACAYSSRKYDNRKEIVDIATVILQEAQKGEGANYITYGSYIRVLRFFVMDNFERYQLIRSAFRHCCEDGQLSKSVLWQMRPALSDHEYNMLIKEATDPKTGRLRVRCTKNATLLISHPSFSRNRKRKR